MKKVLVFSILCSVVLCYYSCRKIEDKSGAIANSKPEMGQVANRNGSATQSYWAAFGYCAGEAKDCGPHTLIIFKRPRLNDLQVAVGNGPGAIGTFFSDTDNWDVFPDNYPSTSQMENLASGNYNIIIVQSTTDEDRYCFLCGPTSTLTSENPEFVVEATYQD